jgi:hypothetical protein
VTSPPAARRGRESVGAEPDWFVRRQRQRLSLDTESMLSGSSEYLESNNTPLLKNIRTSEQSQTFQVEENLIAKKYDI